MKKSRIMLFSALGLMLCFSAYGGDKKGKNEKKTEKDLTKGSASLTAEEVVKKLQDYYDSIVDFQADFEQVYKHKIYDEEKTSSGRVYIARPGKMRWEYKKPEKKLFVADGQYIWVFEESINQVTKQALDQSDLPVAITFLVGKGRLSDEFDSTLVPHESFAKKGMLVLELKPRNATTQYKKLLMIVDKKKYRVERTIIIDKSGNTNTMRFMEPQINKGISEKKFQFKPPKGATVIEP
ncbi:MAG: outer membrane lipoprotein chaperone LolA [Pseudomonadota bacterium]